MLRIQPVSSYLIPFLLIGFVSLVFSQSKQAARESVAEAKGHLPEYLVHSVHSDALLQNRIYAATAQGLAISDDGALSWKLVPVAWQNAEVFTAVSNPVNPKILYTGRRDGLWRSEDGGKNWQPLPSPVAGPYAPLVMAIPEVRPDMIYVGTARSGLHRSDNSGLSWSNATNGLPRAWHGGPEEIRSLAVHPNDPETVYVAYERHGLYRTINGGRDWEPLDRRAPLALKHSVYPPRLTFDSDSEKQLLVVFGERIHSHLVHNRLYRVSQSGEWLPIEVELPENELIVAVAAHAGAGNFQIWTDKLIEVPRPSVIERGKSVSPR